MAIFQDLTGKQFGRLRVLSRAMNDKSGGARYLCICDCGGQTTSSAADLRRGASKSCGCATKFALHDLTGRRFGLLTAKELVGRDKRGQVRWLCICDCGKASVVGANNLRSGRTRSCGCLKRPPTRDPAKPGGPPRNPWLGTVEHLCWRMLRQRCYNPNHKSYKHYGGRGITVCGRWLYGEGGRSGFECFLADMGAEPHPELTIERRNNDGNYEPSNCYWAPIEIQANNRRDNIRITIGGVTKTIAQWARQADLNSTTISWRLKRNCPPEILLAPLGPTSGRHITIGGVTKTIAEWGRQSNLSETTIRLRLKRGWPPEDLLLPPDGRFRSR